MRSTTYLTLLAAPFVLAACDSAEESLEPANEMMAEERAGAENMPMADDMPMMGTDGDMRMASAEGTITAIDEQGGTITIDHGPVPAVDWPAMTMAFEAEPALRQQVAVGDEVAFDFQTSASGSRITSIDER